MIVSRRRLLLAGGAVVVLGAGGVALGPAGLRHQVAVVLRPDPVPPHPVPSGPVGAVLAGSFRSTAMGNTTGWSVAYPYGIKVGTALPIFLVLHGRGDSHREVLGGHRLGAFLSDAVRAGSPPFAVVGVDGGDHSYWHTRSSGEDPQRMLLEELLPLLATRGLRTQQIAVGGWSMGGYGALLLAERLGPKRVLAVAADSPALWSHWAATAPGAFDGPGDFAAHDVLAGVDRLAGIPVRVSCGTADPFMPGVTAFLRAVPTAERDVSPGAHDLAWWQHAAPGQLAFIGRQLA